MQIKKTNCGFVREPLKAAFGFKGGYVTELWQTRAEMESQSGITSYGLGTQSTLWSDASVFAANSEAAGNSMMFLLTAYALKKSCEIKWNTPFELLDAVLPDVYKYAKKITCRDDLRLTFALNSLVAADNAAWLLYCREKGITGFDQMVPDKIKPALSARHTSLANVPLMSYNVPIQGVIDAVNQGYFFLKIKIGCDPDKDGDLDKMLEWDKKRIKEIHEAVKDVETPFTENGKIPYYLDANGRYDRIDRLMKFLDHAEKIGARERIILLEEPFSETYHKDVSKVPARLAADESAHSDKDALEKIHQGYTAVALKPIAKTMSMSLKIAKCAFDNKIPCFCADLTVNPLLVDWNKNVAARLPALPGMRIGVIESNGHQNYTNWEQMKKAHPAAGSQWIEPVKGIFELGSSFYEKSGGIFEG